MKCADRFAKNLRRCRRRSGMSQEQVGLRAALHLTEIGLLERGARVPAHRHAGGDRVGAGRDHRSAVHRNRCSGSWIVHRRFEVERKS